MATKINVADLHAALEEAGIPIEGVAFHRENGVRVDYKAGATKEQRAAALAIIERYDQDAVEAAKALEQQALESKAALGRVNDTALVALIADPQTRGVMANLLARIELLERKVGIEQSSAEKR